MSQKRERTLSRSELNPSPPPTYSSGGAPPLPPRPASEDRRSQHVQYPTSSTSSTNITTSDGASPPLRPYDPYAMTNGQRRSPNDDSVAENLLRLQRISELGPRLSMAPTAVESESISHFSATGYAASITASQNDGEAAAATAVRGGSASGMESPEPRSGTGDIITSGDDEGGAVERNITNYVNIVRRATPHHRIFSLFFPNPQIVDTFYIDPHLRIPGGVLSAVQSSARPPAAGAGAATRRTEQRENRRSKLPKNMSLELHDGKMNITIHLIADSDPSSSSTRRLRSVNSLQSEMGHGSSIRKPTVQRTVLVAKLSTTRPKTFKAYPMHLRIFAPKPRAPFFLQATCVGETGVSRSPLTLYIPRSFHGPMTLKILVGNIDHHLWLSPAVQSVARMMSEDDQSRGYFLGALPDTMEEEDSGDEASASPAQGLSPREEQEWQGDKAEIQLGNGRLRILFESENLEGIAEISGNGWIWPAKWG